MEILIKEPLQRSWQRDKIGGTIFDEVYPGTRHQRCWVHKTMNVLNALPKTVQPKAKQALHDI